MVTNILQYPYWNMIESSTMTIGELGNPLTCNEELGDFASYAMLTLNLTEIPINLRFGLCLPK